MNQVDLIKDIEEKYDIKNISSNDLPIWQYIRNLLCSQNIQSNHQAPLNTIKRGYYMMKNRSWGNIPKQKT